MSGSKVTTTDLVSIDEWRKVINNEDTHEQSRLMRTVPYGPPLTPADRSGGGKGQFRIRLTRTDLC